MIRERQTLTLHNLIVLKRWQLISSIPKFRLQRHLRTLRLYGPVRYQRATQFKERDKKTTLKGRMRRSVRPNQPIEAEVQVIWYIPKIASICPVFYTVRSTFQQTLNKRSGSNLKLWTQSTEDSRTFTSRKNYTKMQQHHQYEREWTWSAQSQMKPPCRPCVSSMASQYLWKFPLLLPMECEYLHSPIVTSHSC